MAEKNVEFFSSLPKDFRIEGLCQAFRRIQGHFLSYLLYTSMSFIGFEIFLCRLCLPAAFLWRGQESLSRHKALSAVHFHFCKIIIKAGLIPPPLFSFVCYHLLKIFAPSVFQSPSAVEWLFMPANSPFVKFIYQICLIFNLLHEYSKLSSFNL